jgi:hypothetical protein
MNRLELALLRDDIATLRPGAVSDAGRLLDILTHPDIVTWRGHWNLERVHRSGPSMTPGLRWYSGDVFPRNRRRRCATAL